MEPLRYTSHIITFGEGTCFEDFASGGFRAGYLQEGGKPTADCSWESASNSDVSKIETGFD
jgi:hypothetical protein